MSASPLSHRFVTTCGLRYNKKTRTYSLKYLLLTQVNSYSKTWFHAKFTLCTWEETHSQKDNRRHVVMHCQQQRPLFA